MISLVLPKDEAQEDCVYFLMFPMCVRFSKNMCGLPSSVDTTDGTEKEKQKDTKVSALHLWIVTIL